MNNEIFISQKNSIKVYDLNKRSYLPKINKYNRIQFNKDSSRIVMLGKSQIKLLNSNYQLIKEIAGKNNSNDVFSSDGKFFLTSDNDVINIWNSETGELNKKFSGPDSEIGMVKFFGNDSRILSIHKNNSAYLWHVKRLRNNQRIP